MNGLTQILSCYTQIKVMKLACFGAVLAITSASTVRACVCARACVCVYVTINYIRPTWHACIDMHTLYS